MSDTSHEAAWIEDTVWIEAILDPAHQPDRITCRAPHIEMAFDLERRGLDDGMTLAQPRANLLDDLDHDLRLGMHQPQIEHSIPQGSGDRRGPRMPASRFPERMDERG
jgi:hypothetical protein